MSSKYAFHGYYHYAFRKDFKTAPEALQAFPDENLDPETGRWRKGVLANTLEHHIGGASHI
jgi:hypothetical protein